MKQVVQDFRSGEVMVEDVPAPTVKPGCVLVRNQASLISAGTEGGTVKLGKMSMLGKARARPEQVKKVLQAVRTEGLLGTVSAVNRTLDLPIALGYSCAGTVVAVGEGVHDLSVGAKVACGGAGMAYHAGVVVVPRNLCVPLADHVAAETAAFTTIGAIATQSVRIADLKLGESAVVIGLGLVGLLTVEVLRAAGCRVIGIDASQTRVDWVNEQGICTALARQDSGIRDQVLAATGGFGADAVIVTAGVNNNDPVALAGELARYKGRVVVVGRTVMEAPRETYLFKELELCTSLAYGPGTGDPSYELAGYDYPIGYVRWTENRNMQCFVELLADQRINVARLITQRFPVAQAAEAFAAVTESGATSIGVVLSYDESAGDLARSISKATAAAPRAATGGVVRVGLIGTGSFATNIMLPLLARRSDVSLAGLVSATGTRAAALAKKYRVATAATDADVLIDDPDVDVVFILTRHGTHARYAAQALRRGKHVFVEKPLAMTNAELDEVVTAQRESGKVLMVGHNRRYAPLAVRLRDFFAGRRQPMVINFRGNVGFRPPEHWLHDPVDGGGVVLGEGCHYIDFCRWLVDAPITAVAADCVGDSRTSLIPEDNARINLRFADGSLATVLYLSNGARALGREACEVHAEAKSAVWRDFKHLRLVNDLSLPRSRWSPIAPDKGFAHELDAFFAEVGGATDEAPAWLAGQLDSAQATIQAAGQLHGRS